MFHVYIIRSKKAGSIDIGYTADLKRRIKEHNNSDNQSTKGKIPVELVYYEAYKSIKDAKYQESNLKRFAKSYQQLKRRVKNSLLNGFKPRARRPREIYPAKVGSIHEIASLA